MGEGLNKWMGLGNLGADPELRTTAGGQTVLKLRMACTENYLDRDGVRKERTEWLSISVWGKRGEALSKFLTKGDRIFVEGRIETSSYEKDGEKRYRTEVVASNVILNGKGAGQQQAPAAAQPSGRQRPPARAPQQSFGPQDDGVGYDDEPLPF